MQRTHRSTTISVVFVATAFILAASAASSTHARELTFEDRVKAQRAIEQVYWNHRIWPEQSSRAKPALDEVLPASAIEAKVRAYLRLSDARREAGRPVTHQHLLDEMDRMVQDSKAPGVLRALFAALGNDLFVIEETVVRQKLVERLAADLSDDPPGPEEVTKDFGATAPNRSARTEPQLESSSESTSRTPFDAVGAASPRGPETGSAPAAFAGGCQLETWNPTSTGPGVPQGREGHTAVWTGSEMIVWGGVASDSSRLNDGGRYDPATDSWSTVSTVGAPEPRSAHTAVWTGSELIVWGGISQAGVFQTGGRYDPAMDTWTPTSLVGAPEGRQVHTAVWTGTEMIVWGGFTTAGVSTATGSRYDPTSDAWTPTSTALAPDARGDHTALWMSGLMIVWGGQVGPPYVHADSGGRYNPSTDTWLPTATLGAPPGRDHHTAVATGREMIVWGGYADSGFTTTGGRYDPSADVWLLTTNVGVPSGCGYHSAVWTGDRMMVWGGWGPATGDTNTGGRYAPATDTWTPTTTLGAPERRGHHTAVWTGTEMIIWGGKDSATDFNTGGRYCPGCDDQNPCTTDADDPVSGCTHTVTVGAPCDDGESCTEQDSCSATGMCIGQPLPANALCNDGNACTTGDVCDAAGVCVAGPPTNCDDGNPCTVDVCDPAVGCRHGSPSCDDHNACNGLETCDPVTGCRPGTSLNCDDGNACTQDRCDPSSGCQHPPIACQSDGCTIRSCDPAVGCTSTPQPAGTPCEADGDRCTADRCDGAGVCVAGPFLDCNDGNLCTVDFCSSGRCTHDLLSCDDHIACTRDVCSPSTGECGHLPEAPFCDDHDAGTMDICNPAAGGCEHIPCDSVCNDNNPCTNDLCGPALCYHTLISDGGVCNDNDLCTSGDACQAGTCTPAFNGLNEPNPRTTGYYRRLCQGPHSGDELTDADAVCVAQITATFAGIATVAQICDVIQPSQPDNDKCGQAEDDLMVLALNICRARVCTAQSIDSQCGGNTNVGQSLAESDAILASPSRDRDACIHAKCLDEEINIGRALEMNTLALGLEGSDVRLAWLPPYLDDGTGQPKKYNVWRRLQGSLSPFAKLGDTTEPAFLDTTSGSDAFEYEITSVMN